MTANQRALLERYIQSGKLMQVSSLAADGSPALCHVWYSYTFHPDRLFFISRKDRVHSTNIRNDPRVAGGIVAIPLTGLGQTVRGVTFKGLASQLGPDSKAEIGGFVERWPNANSAISVERQVAGETMSRLYQISITEWLLFDEENFPSAPRRLVAVGE
jgi:uncharacterized protein YhbP (UPF0306 family)